MVHFVGAGSGAVDLITIRGKRLLEEADVIIYAGSLVNPALLEYAGKDCQIHNSAYLHLDEVIELMKQAEAKHIEQNNPCIAHTRSIQQSVQHTEKYEQSHNDAPRLTHGKSGSHHHVMNVCLVGLENRPVPVYSPQSNSDHIKGRYDKQGE